MTHFDDPRFSQECRDRLQHVRVTLVGVIKSRSVNEHDPSTVQNELLRFLDLGCARLELIPDFEIGSACLIHELEGYLFRGCNDESND